MDLEITFNGTLYNENRTFKEIINEFYKGDNLLDAILNTISIIDGEYSFSVSDGENLALVRDQIGTKPIFYKDSDFSDIKINSDYNVVKPGYILFNGKEIKIPKKEFDLNDSLENLLKSSIFKRVSSLDEIAIVFSGGIDSSLIALILKNYPVKLYAVGRENSKDLEYAKKVAKSLNLPLKCQIVTEEVLRNSLLDVVKAIGENNLMKIGVGMTIYFATKMIAEDGINVAISGQGADELFAGYNRYLRSYSDGTLQEELEHDIKNMYHVNLQRDYAVSKLNNVELRLPYLDEKLVNYALNIPISEKITSSEDKLRKKVLRNLAFNLGLPNEFAYRPKKAAQYGTGIDKLLRRKILKDYDLDELIFRN